MGKKRQVSIGLMTIPFLVAVVVLFATLMVVEFNVSKLTYDKNAEINRYALCMESADALYSRTVNLTNEARMFVSGQGLEHIGHYIEENAKKNNPSYTLKKLKKAGVDSGAVSALKQGLTRSETLVDREMLAMALVCKTDIYKGQSIPVELSDYPIPEEYRDLSKDDLSEAANNLLFEGEYSNIKIQIYKSIDNCTQQAKSVHYKQLTQYNNNYNNLRTVREMTYFILFALTVCFIVLFSKIMYGNVVKMMTAVREDKPMKPSRINCYNYLAQAHNKMRVKLYAELQQSRISNNELQASMKETGRFISIYDVEANRYTVHEEIAKRLNITTVYENMPHDFLAAVKPLLDDEDLDKTEAFYNGILAGSAEGEMELKVRTKNHTTEWQRYSYRTVFDENKNPIRAIVTIINITAGKKQALFYNGYIMSLENRVLLGHGAFVWMDVTDGKLLKFARYFDSNLTEASVNSLEELFSHFDGLNVSTLNGESFRKIFGKNNLLEQFELGNHDFVTYWHCERPDGTTLELEMLTMLITNPTTGNTEAAIQIYTQNKANSLLSASAKNILFVQNSGQERDVLINALKPYFDINVADSCKDAKLLLEVQNKYNIIILDLGVADENPFDFITEIKELRGTTPILAITDGSIPQSVNALESGVEDIQRKPINTTLIKHRIGNILSKQEALATIQNDIDNRDEVTGLLGRKSFVTFTNAILSSCTHNEEFIMMCMDVADFKIINSRFGNQKADEVLKFIGDTIQRAIEGTVGVAMRARADRFYVLVPNDKSLIDALCDSIKNLDYKLPASIVVRIGIYKPIVDESVEDMMNKVVLAIDSLRGNKSKTVAWFNDKMLETSMLNQLLTEDFKMAMEEGQIVPYFQPKYDYGKKYYVGAEALARWIHPSLGFLSPNKFISVFEKEGLITELDLYILEKVCQCQRKWKDEGLSTLRVSVNLSPIDFSDLELAEKVLQIIDKYSLTCKDIRFEITETSYGNDSALLIDFIDKIHEKGFLVDMDDFGSGYSSLNMLDEINVDSIKLDIKMTHNNNNYKGKHILGAVIRMAGWLKIDVLAEGIETEQQAEYVYNLGCTYMQGYYFSKPLPTPAFKELLGENGKKTQIATSKETKKIEASLTNSTTIDTGNVSNFAKTVGEIFSLVITQNYTKNKYYIMEHDNSSTTIANTRGEYDELIRIETESYHPDERQNFSASFRRETILGLFEEGQNKFTHIGRQLSDDGEYHWIRTNVLVYRDVDGDVKGYTLSRNVDDEFKNRSAAEGYQRVIAGMSKVFVCVFEVNVIEGLLKEIHMPAAEREYIAPVSDFNESLSAWARNDLSQEDFEKFRYFCDFSDLTERINTNTNTSITFLTKSTGWQTVTLVELERNVSGKVIKVLWLSQNVDEKKQQEMILEDIREAFAQAYDMAYQLDLDKYKCYALKNDKRLRKIIPAVANIGEVIHNFITYGVAKEYQKKMLEFVDLDTLNERLKGKRSISIEYEDRTFVWLRANIVPITYDGDGNIKQFLFGVNLIEKEKLAELDGMTGLLNSATAQEKIEKIFHDGEEIGGVLLVIDVDDLKFINDNKGHQAGTDVICGVAECIKSTFRSTDIIGRYGGDEFIVFLKGYEDRQEQLKKKLQRLLDEISSKQFFEDCTVTCTIGAAVASENTKTFKKLFESADNAIYNAKKDGKNTYKFYIE